MPMPQSQALLPFGDSVTYTTPNKLAIVYFALFTDASVKLKAKSIRNNKFKYVIKYLNLNM
ncbi:MAG: hypothetical protein O7C59_07125 [Rickettsia endosymbiont of Ixodes persulcatus]|nr:hypothetical protein [Rickettsia endosymbiont of Ixodes persulcatus]